jgi:hypothetical protein
MLPIYGKYGEVVGWYLDNTIYSTTGFFLAWIDNGKIFRYKDGCYIGYYWDDGSIRDSQGKVVAFLMGASIAGVELPLCTIPPHSPQPRIAPQKPQKQKMAEIPLALNLQSWGLSWKEFINQPKIIKPVKVSESF